MATSVDPRTDRRASSALEPEGLPAVTDFEIAQHELFTGLDLEVRSCTLDLTPGAVQVYELGRDAEGPALFLVHGSGAFGAFLAPLMAHIVTSVPSPVRIIAFDRPGYGLSGPYEYTTGQLADGLVDLLLEVVDALGLERVDLIGHSMGGHAGIRFALAHPERVRHLGLIGSVPAFPGTAPPLPLRLLTAPLVGAVIRRLQKGGEAGVLELAKVFREQASIKSHPALIRAIAAHEDEPKCAAAGRTELGALITLTGWAPELRLERAQLRELAPPTTVVWGSHDPLAPPGRVREGLDAIPNGRLEVVDTGHIPFLGEGRRCAELIGAMHAA